MLNRTMTPLFALVLGFAARPAAGFAPRSAHRRGADAVASSARRRSALAAAMPEQLADWGCDAALWEALPKGCKRDLERYARDGVEDLARNRVATMREVLAFVDAPDGAAWEKESWDSGVAAWEAEETRKVEEAKAAAKAAAKEKRLAAAAAKKAAAEAAEAAAAA